ncbi:MAG: ribosome silencing factor [Rhodothermales bacterium]|nr:ribosome silencing factor [Rhodothermales bacterium]MDG2016363.1 ribosome silencing factor [Rhodothermales bacterium]HAY37339.1 ribosome silencing factor [Bacteroidota bacterium]
MPERSEDKQRSTPAPVKELTRLAVDAILDKKGRDIEVFDVRGVSGVADFFIVTTGESELQVKAIVQSIRASIKENANERPWHVEGVEHNNWVLMDYVDLVVHVFLPEMRSYYSLERLWGDSPRETVADESSAAEMDLLKD